MYPLRIPLRINSSTISGLFVSVLTRSSIPRPNISTQVGSAPLSNNSFTTSMCPEIAASFKGLKLELGVFTLAPWSSNILTIFKLPLQDASISGVTLLLFMKFGSTVINSFLTSSSLPLSAAVISSWFPPSCVLFLRLLRFFESFFALDFLVLRFPPINSPMAPFLRPKPSGSCLPSTNSCFVSPESSSVMTVYG